ncbi:hypothetical protein [Agarivorans sp. QJM3NY_25]|uniref:hypothetical protein n=1 Tax=Agarivorans sp. QJM3NY_25 TaxID=3421430 RepID=UPI003D7E7D63
MFEDLHKLANLKAGNVVTINWLPYNDEQLFKLPLRVRKSVLYYRHRLPTLVAQHGIEIGVIKEFRTEVHRAKNHQIYTCAIAIDLNGKEYRKSIW